MLGQPDRRARRHEVARRVRPILDRRSSRPAVEWLEERMLLDGTPITSGQASSILTALRALGAVGSRIDANAAIINRELPVVGRAASQPEGSLTPVSLAALAPLGGFLTSSFYGTFNTYFSTDASPTVEELQQVLVRDLSPGAPGNITAGVSDGRLRFEFRNLGFGVGHALALNLGGGDTLFNLGSDATATPVNLTVAPTMPLLEFSVDASDRFVMNAPQVIYDIREESIQNGTVSYGFLEATVAVGSIDFGSDPANPVNVRFIDPTGQGELTTAQLQDPNLRLWNEGAGTYRLDVALPLQATVGRFSTSATAPPTVTIRDADVFDATEAAFGGRDVEPLHPFNTVAPGQFLELIDKVATIFDRLNTSTALDAPLPFVAGLGLGQTLDVGSAIRSALTSKLVTIQTIDGKTTAVPTFKSIQGLARELARILNIPLSRINVQYDPTTQIASFTVVFITANPTRSAPFSLERPDLGVVLADAQADVAIASNSNITFTFGASLQRSCNATLITTDAATSDDQTDPPQVPANGRLAADAHFSLTIDAGAPVAVTVTRASTLDNNDPLDLVGDLDAAIRAAGITTVAAGLNTPNPVLYAASLAPTPANGRLTADAHFSLTIDGNTPVAVTVARTATADNQLATDLLADLNAALAAAGITSVVAGMNTNTDSTGVEHFSFKFSPATARGVRLLRLESTATDPTVTQLGFAVAQASGYDRAQLTLSSTTPESLLFLSLDAAPDDPAVTQLGFRVDQATRPQTDRYFIQEVGVSGVLTMQRVASPGVPTGRFGFLGAQADSGGINVSANVTMILQDPNGGSGTGRIDLQELLGILTGITVAGTSTAGSATIRDLSSTAGLIVGQVVTGQGIAEDTILTALSGDVATLSKPATASAAGVALNFSDVPRVASITVNGFGTATLNLSFPGLAAAQGASVPLYVLVDDLNDPAASTRLDTSQMGPFGAFRHLNAGHVVDALQRTADALASSASFRDRNGRQPLTFALPMINRTVTQLVDYAGAMQRFVAGLRGVTADTVQSFLTQANELLKPYASQTMLSFAIDTSGPAPAGRFDLSAVTEQAQVPGLKLDLEGVPLLVSLAPAGTPSLAVAPDAGVAAGPASPAPPATRPVRARERRRLAIRERQARRRERIRLARARLLEAKRAAQAPGAVGGGQRPGLRLADRTGRPRPQAGAIAPPRPAPAAQVVGPVVATPAAVTGDASNLAGVSKFVDDSANPTPFTTLVSSALQFAVGLDLAAPATPVPFLYDNDALAKLGVQSSGTDLNRVPVSFGRVGLYINGGTASVDSTYVVGISGGPNGRNDLDQDVLTRAAATISGTAAASLPISLAESLPPATPPVTIPILDLNLLLNQAAGAVGPIAAPDLSQDFDLIELIQQSPDLISGLNRFLREAQDQLNTQILSNPYPVVGEQLARLGQVLEQFRVKLLFQVANDAQLGNPIAAIQETLFDLFGPGTGQFPGLGWLTDADGNPSNSIADVNIGTSIGGQSSPDGLRLPASVSTEYVNYSMRLKPKPIAPTTPLNFDLGLPGLQMAFPLDSSHAGRNVVDAALNFDYLFNFGVAKEHGFYVDTRNAAAGGAAKDMTIRVDAAPASADALAGTFGYFGIDATPDRVLGPDNRKTGFHGTFGVNVANTADATAPILAYADLLAERLKLAATLAATGDVNLTLKTKFNNTSFSLSALTDFGVQWNFAPTDPDLSGQKPTVGFYNIRSDWAESVENFLGPTFGKVISYTDQGAVGDILDFIAEKPLPVISYLFGDTTVVDFLSLLATATGGGPAAGAALKGFFEVLEAIRNLYRSLPAGGYDPRYALEVQQGQFVLDNTKVDARTLKSLADIGLDAIQVDDKAATPFLDQIDAYEADPKNKDFTTEKDGGVISGALSKSVNVGFANASLSLPFFQDPAQIKQMLLGREVDLFRVVTPSLGFTIDASISFPPIPIGPFPLVIKAGGYIQPSLQFGFGFDTRGYARESQGISGATPSDGFFFIADKTVLDVPLKLYFGAGVGIPDIASVGIDIYFLWDNALSLKDPNGDDKVHLDEFDGLKIGGSLSVGAEVDVQILVFHKYLEIWPPQVLFSYGAEEQARPGLARVDDGVLRLDLGAARDGGEAYTIRHVAGASGDETVAVSAFGVTETYAGIRRIVADGGLGDDVIVVEAGVLADATLTGGSGRDSLIYRGSGRAVLRGGLGDDRLEAGTVGAGLFGDDGDDTLIGGLGDDLLSGGSGHDALDGGPGIDTVIHAGGRSYTLSDTGLAVDAFLSSLARVERADLRGGDGDDLLRVVGWGGVATFDGVNGFDTHSVQLGGGGTTTILHSGPIGRGRVRITGGGGGDVLTIANTTTTAGAEVVHYGTDLEVLTIDGAGGDDTFNVLGGAEGLTEILGGEGGDVLNVAATNRFSRTTFDGGRGRETVRIGRATGGLAATVPSASVLGGLVVRGGEDGDRFEIDLADDLRNLVQLGEFEEDGGMRVRGDLDHALLTDGHVLESLVIDGSLRARGLVRAAEVGRMAVGGDLAGSVLVAGRLGTLDVGGSLTGRVVAGTMGAVAVGGATPGTIAAGDVGLVTAAAATGPDVLRIVEAGVERLLVASPVAAGRATDGVRFAYAYDSTAGDPQLGVRAINGDPASSSDDAPIDLHLRTDSAAEFDLARLDARGTSGIRHVVIEGDLLATARPETAASLGLPPGAPGGIRLPLDRLGGLTVQDRAAARSVHAAGVEAVSFGGLGLRNGRRTIPAESAGAGLARLVKTPRTRIRKAAGVFRVPVGEGRPVAFFLATRPSGRFDPRAGVLLTDRAGDNASEMAVITVSPGRRVSRIDSIAFLGEAGSSQVRHPAGDRPGRLDSTAVDASLAESMAAPSRRRDLAGLDGLVADLTSSRPTSPPAKRK